MLIFPYLKPIINNKTKIYNGKQKITTEKYLPLNSKWTYLSPNVIYYPKTYHTTISF